jgi:hypothetical protein
MAKYCVTYDAKDALAWDPEELKLDIAELLVQNKALNLESPVASAIIFEDGNVKPNISFWNSILSRKFQEDVYYYLCVVASNRDGDYIDRNEGDADMNADFQEMLEDLEE